MRVKCGGRPCAPLAALALHEAAGATALAVGAVPAAALPLVVGAGPVAEAGGVGGTALAGSEGAALAFALAWKPPAIRSSLLEQAATAKLRPSTAGKVGRRRTRGAAKAISPA